MHLQKVIKNVFNVFSSFHAIGLFLYPLKTSENLCFFPDRYTHIKYLETN